MSRRGNAYDNAAMESLFVNLKKERVRRRTYRTIGEARADVCDYVEVFYNRKRRHEHLGGMSPVQFARKKLEEFQADGLISHSPPEVTSYMALPSSATSPSMHEMKFSLPRVRRLTSY